MRAFLLAAALIAAPLMAYAQGGAHSHAHDGEPEPVPLVATPQQQSEGAAFLASNRIEPGVVTLPSGLQYRVLAAGQADAGSPRPQDLVAVYYEGKLLDGKVFDGVLEDTQPAVFPLFGLIPAWVEAMQLMHPGDEWMLWSPPELAYGDRGDEVIPANSVLSFRIKLVAFQRRGA